MAAFASFMILSQYLIKKYFPRQVLW